MPEGPLGFDRRLADSVLVLDLEFSKDVPFNRDQHFTNDYIRRFRNEDLILNRKTNIEIGSRELSPENIGTSKLGTPIEEVGTITIELTDPPSVTYKELDSFIDNMKDIVFQALRDQGIDTGILVKVSGEIRSKINGPAGGPRPFVPSEILFEAIYTREMAKEIEIRLEELFADSLDIRIDAKVEGNKLYALVRDQPLDTIKRDRYRAIFRDVGKKVEGMRPPGTKMRQLSIKANGGRI